MEDNAGDGSSTIRSGQIHFNELQQFIVLEKFRPRTLQVRDGDGNGDGDGDGNGDGNGDLIIIRERIVNGKVSSFIGGRVCIHLIETLLI